MTDTSWHLNGIDIPPGLMKFSHYWHGHEVWVPNVQRLTVDHRAGSFTRLLELTTTEPSSTLPPDSPPHAQNR